MLSECIYQVHKYVNETRDKKSVSNELVWTALVHKLSTSAKAQADAYNATDSSVVKVPVTFVPPVYIMEKNYRFNSIILKLREHCL